MNSESPEHEPDLDLPDEDDELQVSNEPEVDDEAEREFGDPDGDPI